MGRNSRRAGRLPPGDPGNTGLLSQNHTTRKLFPNLIPKMVKNKAQPLYLEFSDHDYDSSIENFKILDGHDIGFF